MASHNNASSSMLPTDKEVIPSFPWIPPPPPRMVVKATSHPKLKKAISMSLGGKIISDSPPPLKEIKFDLYKAWKFKCMVIIQPVTKNIISIQFTNEADRKMVFMGGPWFVGRDILILAEASEFSNLTRTKFIWSKMWVRIFDLPPTGLTVDVSDIVGLYFGGVVEYDVPKGSEEDEDAVADPFCIKQDKDYLRVKVLLNITKPLHRELPLDISIDEDTTISLDARVGYECLPDFCYCCGVIGHGFKACKFFDGSIAAHQMPYNDSLRSTKIFLNRSWQKWDKPIKAKSKGMVSSSLNMASLHDKSRSDKEEEDSSSLVGIDALDAPPTKSAKTVNKDVLPAPVVMPETVVVPNSAPSVECTPANFHNQFMTPQQTYNLIPDVGVNHNNLMNHNHRIQFGAITPWSTNYNLPPDPAYMRFLAASQHFDLQDGTLFPGSRISGSSVRSFDEQALQNVFSGRQSYFNPLEKSSPVKEKKKRRKKLREPSVEDNLEDVLPVDLQSVKVVSDPSMPLKENVSIRTRSAGKRPISKG